MALAQSAAATAHGRKARLHPWVTLPSTPCRQPLLEDHGQYVPALCDNGASFGVSCTRETTGALPDPSHTQGREGLKTEGNPSTGRRDWDSSPGRPAGTDGDWVFWPS